MSNSDTVKLAHMRDTLIGADSAFQLICVENGITGHRKLRSKWKDLDDLEYTEPGTSTKKKLTEEELFEVRALESFISASSSKAA